MNTPLSHQRRLEAHFNFTPDDLAINKEGWLSEAQRTKIESKKQDYLKVIRIGTPILVVVAGLLFLLSEPLMRVIGFFLLIALPFAIGALKEKIRQLQKEIDDNKAARYCGIIHLGIEEHKGRYSFTTYHLNAGGEFTLKKDQFMNLHNHEMYCVYYTPYSKSLMSIEVTLPPSLNSTAQAEEQPMNSPNLSQQRFGPHAQNYVASPTHAKGADLDLLLEMASPQPHWSVLDVATGGGHTALKFAPHVAHVVASDLTLEMLAAAEAHLTGKGVANVEFKPAAAESLPFDNAVFDLVTCRIAPHHFDDAARFVQEAARVTKPGGLVLVQDQLLPDDDLAARYVEAFEKLRDPSHNHAFTETEWRGMFEAAGLTVERVEHVVKSHQFAEWTTTQSVTPRTKECLIALLHLAPPVALEWLQPRDLDTPEATFVNHHILLAGRKSG